MDILIRKIQRRGKNLTFKPNSKGGYKFTEDSAQPCLTPFQKSCIQVKPQKDRKLGSFWTPDFCYIGTLMVQDGQASLQDMINDGGAVSMVDFNSYFPNKKWYWYNKASPQNMAMQTYFIGVRAAASILNYYYELQKQSRIKEANVLHERYLKPLGIAKLLADVDSNLLSTDDGLYSVNLTDGDCIIKSDKVKVVVKNSRNTVDTDIVSQTREEESKQLIGNNKTISRSNYNKEDDKVSIWDEPIEVPKGLRVPTIKPKSHDELNSNIVAINDINTEDSTTKKNPHTLPKIGEQ